MKKVLASVLAAAMVLGTASVAFAGNIAKKSGSSYGYSIICLLYTSPSLSRVRPARGSLAPLPATGPYLPSSSRSAGTRP